MRDLDGHHQRLSMSSPIVGDLRQAVQFGAILEVKLFHSSDDGASVV
jgi:hypothetical protein